MSGTPEGNKKTAKTLTDRDPDYYRKLGAKGGKRSQTRGFKDNPELARKAGKKGGRALWDKRKGLS